MTEKAQVMCLQETWLDPLTPSKNLLENDEWIQHNNSVGKGKGVSTFWKKNFKWHSDITKPNYQMTKIQTDHMDIINIYRSSGAENKNFIEDLVSLITPGKEAVILGDFNICYSEERFSPVFETLEGFGFKQIVSEPTHIEGRMIDLVFFFSSDAGTEYKARQQAQYFTDHDLIQVVRGKY